MTDIEPRRLRFWRWVHQRTEGHLRRAYVSFHKHDRKCPNCRRWGALGGFDWQRLRRIDDWHDGLTCTVCGHESVWFMGSMLPVLREGDNP